MNNNKRSLAFLIATLLISSMSMYAMEEPTKIEGEQKLLEDMQGYGAHLLEPTEGIIAYRDIEGFAQALKKVFKLQTADIIRLFKIADLLKNDKAKKLLMLALVYQPMTKEVIMQLPLKTAKDIALYKFTLLPKLSKAMLVSALSQLKGKLLEKYLDVRDRFDIVIPIFDEEGEIIDLDFHKLSADDIQQLKEKAIGSLKRIRDLVNMLRIRKEIEEEALEEATPIEEI
ncbi:hypothetical protein ACFLYA_02815 [Candidatus Dependentiae bacterium]